jgi:large subunit ribosomal protein L4
MLKKYDISGKEIGEEKEILLKKPLNEKVVKGYIVALLNNFRQFSANTKTRSEIKATGKKPQKQKGLGRARQGSLVAPQFKGGGIVFGPKPIKRRIRLNKKEKKAAVKAILNEKIKDNKLFILKNSLEKPKTKTLFEFFKKLKLENKKVLVIGVEGEEALSKSIGNILKKHFTKVSTLNGYEISVCQEIVMTEKAFDEIKKGGEK